MKNRATAIILILLIIGAGVAAIYFFQPIEPETELGLESSVDYSIAIINEFNPDSDPNNEFIEIYAYGDPPSFLDWTLTTYDDDIIILPAFTSTQANSYIRVFSGNGTNDEDLSDRQATIYANMASSILDLDGDEIGLHDANGSLVSFIRYDGGNGDAVPEDWDDDIEPSVPANNDSVSFFWEDFPAGNWLHTPSTPGEPNIVSFTTSGDFGGEEVWIINGLRNDIEFEGFEAGLGLGENITVTASAGVNVTVVNLIKEHINFSLNLYRELGFGDPKTDNANRIRIRVVNTTDAESTGATSGDGSITITVGQSATKEELKLLGEHELMHSFHFKSYNDSANGTYRHLGFFSRWFVEGQAEFFGMWSMLKNYPNMTMSSWMAMAKRIGSLNWFDHYRDLNGTGAFEQWSGTWDNYMAVFLFTKWMNETYGPDILLQIYNETRYYGAGDVRNVSPEQALAKVLNKTLDELLVRFWSWLLLDAHHANGVPLYTPHIRLNYTDTAVNDTATVRGRGGAIIEEVDIDGESPFTILLNYSHPDAAFVASVLVFYEDGTNETIIVEFNRTTKIGEVHINPTYPKKIAKIWIVKGLVTRFTEAITMTIIPDHDEVVNMTYNGEGLNDTVTLDPGESAYEVIYLNDTTAFSLFLNWTGGNKTRLNFTIIRFWDDGSNDTFRVGYENDTWRGYVLNPDAGPVSVTKLIIIKENLNETSVSITMALTPANETPSNANDPMIPFVPWWLWDSPFDSYWDSYGGFLQGYVYLDPTQGYDFLGEVWGGDIYGFVLAANLSIVLEFALTPSSPQFQMLNPDYGIYYIVLFGGEGNLDWIEVKPYDWP
ncbi:MAG: lamin tail domain-containing protein [Candidatus Thorarchaeota archaeon]